MANTRQTRSYKAQADAIAKARGGRCISDEIQFFTSDALWKCAVKEHPAWRAQFQRVRGFPSQPGKWCPVCGIEKRRHSIEHVRQALSQRGVKLLSTIFNGVELPIRCECLKCGNVWETKYRQLKRGHGCPECGKLTISEKKRLPRAYVADFLKKRGITLLSVLSERNHSRLLCRCDSCGHEWQPDFGNVKAGGGCPRCGKVKCAEKQRHSYEFVVRYLQNLEIDLISSGYVNCETKLRVRFRACGHDAHVSFHQIQSSTRCAKCASNARVTRAEYDELARSRGGRLLEMARQTNLPSTWICSRGHQFRRRFTGLTKRQTFCPICSAGLAERQCRAAVEQLFRVPFRKVRLKDVRGIGGGPIELDMFNETLKLAVEHNGRQHYKEQKNWGGERTFQRQVEHDRRRRDYCQKNGITLIEIRELNTLTPVSGLKRIIKEACLKGGVPLPADFDSIELDLNPTHVRTTEEEMWEKVLTRAKQVNYTVVSTGYPGVHGKLQLICSSGHRYAPTTISFLTGYLCRKCWLHEKRVPVVVFPVKSKYQIQGAKAAQVFDSIEQAAKAIQANPNNVRIVAKGRKPTCKGYRITQVTREQAEGLKKSPKMLREFCEQVTFQGATGRTMRESFQSGTLCSP